MIVLAARFKLRCSESHKISLSQLPAITAAVSNLPSDLNQLTVEIKFYIKQWGQNTIEIGKRLIAAKELVGHGNWSKWLEDNFNLTQESARKFMKIAKRFGNSNTSWNLNSSQMWELLSLPKGETEKFIAEKTAEGKPCQHYRRYSRPYLNQQLHNT